MDPVDVAPTTGGDRRPADHEGRGWHRRFRLRRTARRPPAMQSADKRGPKKMAGEWEKSTVWPSSKTPPPPAAAPPQGRRRPEDAAGPLRFTCSLCADASRYVPRDLERHFEERHRGSAPVFPCHACTFSAQEFSYLQVHLLSHQDTSSCAACSDGVQRTCAEFRAHLAAQHLQNGEYSCQICQEFSTGDAGLFLEHACAHNLTLAAAKDGGVRAGDGAKLVIKAAARTRRCQRCGCEVSRKLLINDDIQAVHICSRDGPGKAGGGGARPAATKPNSSSPKTKLRLTRSAVREMCWLTQDCLSLPGREFLDKYCHLSDPQTTLEETQDFLMKSVAGETGDPKWTKALKSVLSNVPPQINLHPMSGNGKVSNSSDLAVLTVENKITVAQGGAAYRKELKATTTVGKEPAPAEAVGAGRKAPRAGVKRGNGAKTLENRKTRGGNRASSGPKGKESEAAAEVAVEEEEEEVAVEEVKVAVEEEEEAPPRCKVPRKTKKRRSVRRKRRARPRKAEKKAAGLPLKIVLKKNPVKEKQWVSQSCEGGPDPPGQAGPPPAPEETPAALASPGEPRPPDRSEAPPGGPESSGDTGPRVDDSPRTDIDVGAPPPDDRLVPEDADLQTSERRSPVAEGRSASPPEPEISPQGASSSGGPGASSEEGTGPGGAPPDSGPAPAASTTRPPWRPLPLPKSTERTLKLVAASPYQPVRRPAGDQPVVVLNHPDADAPEVARVMEVINRYKGAVRKVLLSRRTLGALSAAAAATATEGPGGGGGGCVRERFLLKLRLRRLSGKKYEVVGGASASGDGGPSFCCWFCGRGFACQEAWVAHRRRHLVEWK